MLKSHAGTKNLDDFVTHAEECKQAVVNSNTALQQESKDKAFKQWMALLMTDDADHKKFGGLQSGLSSQCELSNDQHPESIESVTDALNNHNWDNDWKEKKQKKKQRKKSQKDNNGQQNTNSSDNEKDVTKMTESSFLQKCGGFGENQCLCCGNKGHCSGKCKCKDRPKNKWAGCKGTAQVHNVFDTDVNDNNGQDDLISITRIANNNDDNGNQHQN